VDDGGETVVFVQGRCAVMIAEAAVRFIEEHGRAGLVSGGLERIEAWRSALEGAASSIRGEG
jgi:hypothetical protein